MGAERVLNALGNDVRRQLLGMLRESPRSVGELASSLPVSRPAVSKHLRLLEEAGLVRHEAKGAQNIFYLEEEGFAVAREWIDQFWDEALVRFKLVAENTKERS